MAPVLQPTFYEWRASRFTQILLFSKEKRKLPSFNGKLVLCSESLAALALKLVVNKDC